MAHYFPYDVKLRLLAHSRSFLANQKARNAIVGAENLLRKDIWKLKNAPRQIEKQVLMNITASFAFVGRLGESIDN